MMLRRKPDSIEVSVRTWSGLRKALRRRRKRSRRLTKEVLRLQKENARLRGELSVRNIALSLLAKGAASFVEMREDQHKQESDNVKSE